MKNSFSLPSFKSILVWRTFNAVVHAWMHLLVFLHTLPVVQLPNELPFVGWSVSQLVVLSLVGLSWFPKRARSNTWSLAVPSSNYHAMRGWISIMASTVLSGLLQVIQDSKTDFKYETQQKFWRVKDSFVHLHICMYKYGLQSVKSSID